MKETQKVTTDRGPVMLPPLPDCFKYSDVSTELKIMIIFDMIYDEFPATCWYPEGGRLMEIQLYVLIVIFIICVKL